MPEDGSGPPADRPQRFRFRVVAPDGRELVSNVVEVHFPAPADPLPDSTSDTAQSPAAGTVQPAVSNFRVRAILVTVSGAVQGAFQGETAPKANKHQFAALGLDYQIAVPIDPATGHPSGKHNHAPLSLLKEWGPATPQLFQALVTNESLQVEIECRGLDAEGKEAVVHKVKLTNATAASIVQTSGGRRNQHPDLHELETVAFTFQKIEHLSPADAVLASDDAAA